MRERSLGFIVAAVALALPFGPTAASVPFDAAAGLDGPLPAPGELFHGARVVRVDDALGFVVVAAADGAAFGRAAAADPRVRWVEPDAPRAFVAEPASAAAGPSQWPLLAMRVPAAWDAAGTGDTAAAVCFVDSGIRATHQEIAGPRWLGGLDVVRGDAEPDDESGHGTTVAGVAAAGVRDGFGMHGVADVGLYAAKVLAGDGTGRPSDVAGGIRWCADRPTARLVVSLSLGSYDASSAVRDAVDHARARGRLVVASTGNDGCGDCVQYPARLPGVVAVTCTTARDEACAFASGGPEVALAAPGESLLGPSAADDAAYRTASGTSLAAPHVAGAAALVWATHPALDADGVRARLVAGVRDLGAAGRDPVFGHGRIDALCLVRSGPCDAVAPPADTGACDHPGPDLDGYVCAAVASPFVDVSAGGTRLDLADDGATDVPLGFAFPFHGGVHRTAVVHANGLVGLGPLACGPCVAPALVPSPGSGLVAAYWGDLDPSAGGEVHVATLGAAPDRTFVAQWTAVPPYGGGPPSTFQVVLAEDGDVVVRWKDARASGRDRVAGVQDAQGAAGTRFRFGPFDAVDAAVRFRPTEIDPSIPTAPSGLAATPSGPGEVTLAWRPSAGRGEAVSAYRVYRVDGAEPVLVAEAAPWPRATVAGLAHGEPAAWRVRAVNAVGESAASEAASATAVGRAPALDGVVARPGPYAGSVLVGWAPAGPAADRVVIELSTLGGPFERAAVVPPDRGAYTDAGLVPLAAYRYRVHAENAVSRGPDSETVCVRPGPWPLPGCGPDGLP